MHKAKALKHALAVPMAALAGVFYFGNALHLLVVKRIP